MAARYGGIPGLTGVIVNPLFPTMQPLFYDSPLTEAEAADVATYLATTEGTAAGGEIDWLLIGGLVGLVLLMVFTVVAFRRPKFPDVQKLRSRA